jgi:hypothetical protein
MGRPHDEASFCGVAGEVAGAGGKDYLSPYRLITVRHGRGFLMRDLESIWLLLENGLASLAIYFLFRMSQKCPAVAMI